MDKTLRVMRSLVVAVTMLFCCSCQKHKSHDRFAVVHVVKANVIIWSYSPISSVETVAGGVETYQGDSGYLLYRRVEEDATVTFAGGVKALIGAEVSVGGKQFEMHEKTPPGGLGKYALYVKVARDGSVEERRCRLWQEERPPG